MWAGRPILVGVTGGIACYKACYLVRRLVEAGARVDVVLTRGAAEFVRPLTFEALSGRPVLTSLWEPDRALAHVKLADEAELVIVAPATAHFIARLSQGLADDFLTAMLLARTKPTLLAPAMNDQMYAALITQENLAKLESRGVFTVGPEVGPLAEGPADRPGRMSEPDTIVAHAARILDTRPAFREKHLVVTAGPTRESIDPVRVVTNRSSGKMGFRIAEAAWRRGASVRLITGPSGEPSPVGVEVVRVETTDELKQAVASHLPSADALIMAAAPADYRATTPSDRKHPRKSGPLNLELGPTADVLLETRSLRKPGAVIVGFALETGSALDRAREKLAEKGLDLIVVNDALEPGAGFEVDTNRVTILDKSGNRRDIPLASKASVADAILDAVESRLG